MKQKILLFSCVLSIIFSFAACGKQNNNSPEGYARIAIQEVESAFADYSDALTISKIRVSINETPTDYVAVDAEKAHESMDDIIARVFVDYYLGNTVSDCCVFIGSTGEAESYFYMTDDEVLRSKADEIAAYAKGDKAMEELYSSIILERAHQRNAAYYPSNDELRTWTEVDPSIK